MCVFRKLQTVCIFLVAAAAAQTVTTTGGTTNTVPKFTSSSSIGNSAIAETGGNVGIGTTTPNALLQVYDGVSAASSNSELLSLQARYGGDSAQKALTWRDTINITGQIDTRYNGSLVNMVFGHLYNNGYQTSDLMTITGTGNVGIGTATPTALLQVYDNVSAASSNSEFLSLEARYGVDSAQKALTWRDPNNITGQIDTRYNGSTVDMVFGHLYDNGYQTTDLMSITGSGNVGIGTTSPSQKLVVAGNINIAGSGSGLIFPDGSVQTTAQVQGSTGPQGPQGIQGPTGPQGIQGPPGPGSTSAVCTTLSGSNASCGCAVRLVSRTFAPQTPGGSSCMATSNTGPCSASGTSTFSGACCVCAPN